MNLKPILRTCVVFVIILGVPVLPFLFFGHWMEPWIEQVLQGDWFKSNPFWASLVFIGVLGADIVLPIPSSFVCTYAGHVFGQFGGALVSWIGLNLSCFVGYELGNKLGIGVAGRFSSQRDLKEMQEFVSRSGVWALAVCRAVPIVAEASVLVTGIYQFDRGKFWLTVSLANLGIAICYAFLGEYAAQHGWLGLALAISLALPVALLAPWLLRRRTDKHIESSGSGG